jgi:delta-aminolevulinic acid dehydratase/porphobilinogen synthase
MELQPIGHQYKVIRENNETYLAVMIISEHDNRDDAFNSMFEVMKKESEEIMNREIEELRKQGIRAVTLKEAIKDMTPEELDRFREERNRNFINPLLNTSVKMLKQKEKQLRNKRVK